MFSWRAVRTARWLVLAFAGAMSLCAAALAQPFGGIGPKLPPTSGAPGGAAAGRIPIAAAADQIKSSPEPRPGPTAPGMPAVAGTGTHNAPAIREVGPDLYYLKGKDGQLQAVPGFTFEDFIRLYRQQQQLDQVREPPRFRFEKATLSGAVKGGRVELAFDLHVATTDHSWVRVPLGLATVVLTESPEYSGPGEHLLEFDLGGDGYVLWLRGVPERDAANRDATDTEKSVGSAGEGENNGNAKARDPSATNSARHIVRFKRMLAPLAASGDESRLRLALPRGLAQADLKLTLPLPNAQVKASDGVTVAATRTTADGATLAELSARGGDTEISWRGGKVDAAPQARVVEVVSAIRATVDKQAVTWDAQLAVRSLGEPLETFNVRLPKDAQLEPGATAGYILAVSTDSPRVVTVSLRKPTREPLALRLVAKVARDLTRPREEIDFSGFDVVGAARQSGAVVVAIDGDWRMTWKERREMRDLDQPPDSLAPAADQQASAFEYFAQPFALSGAISPQPTRLDVEPLYLVTVESDRVLLEARLRYKVRGAKVSRLEANLAGWQLDELGPPGLVPESGPVAGDEGALSIPLAQRMRSTFELTVKAHRPLAGENLVDFALPRFVADVVAPPVLVVETADNVDLAPRDELLAQLTPQPGAAPATTTTKSVKRRHPPLVYRVGAGGASARFAADLRVRQRELSADALTDVYLDENATRIEMQIDLRVAYEAVNRVVLEVPRDLAMRRDVTYSLDGAALAPVVLAPMPGATSESGTSRIVLEPPSAIVDKARITIRYALAGIARTETDQTATLSLALPLDTLLNDHRVRIHAPAGASVNTVDATWSAADVAIASSASGSVFRSKSRDLSIALAIRSRPPRTRVELAWIRSQTTSAMRQDRAVLRVATSERRLRVLLPAEAREDRVAVWVDRRQVAPIVNIADDRLVLAIDLDAASAGDASPPFVAGYRNVVLELLYNLDEDASRGIRRTWDPPRLEGDVWTARTLWQVILPRSEHLVVDPAGYTAEHSWGWHALLSWGDMPLVTYWGRRPNVSTAELQRLSGATAFDASDGQTNQYLFSSSDLSRPLSIRTLPRSWIVLLASGGVLIVGLALIYIRPLRHPAMLFALSVAIFALALWSPPLAVLTAQAAAAGLVLTIVAAVSSWWLWGPAASPSAVSTASARIERGSGMTSRRRVELPRTDEENDAGHATTLTVPADAGPANFTS